MVMKPDVVDKAVVQAAYQFENPLMIYMSPRGKPLTQKDIMRFVTARNLLILCGRFEGVDERVLQKRGFEEVSIGDFVLAGGEIPAMALIEACVRTLPGVLGDGESAEEDSFAPGGRLDGLLEYPQYTRPRIWEGAEVPEVLVSGNHAEVAKWRLEQAKELTSTRRPDLWKKYAELIDK